MNRQKVTRAADMATRADHPFLSFQMAGNGDLPAIASCCVVGHLSDGRILSSYSAFAGASRVARPVATEMMVA